MDSVSEEENPRLEESVDEIEVELKNMMSSSQCSFFLPFFARTIFLSPASIDLELLLLCLLLVLIVVCL